MNVDEVNKSHQIQIYFIKIQQVIVVRDWSSLKLKRHLLALKDVSTELEFGINLDRYIFYSNNNYSLIRVSHKHYQTKISTFYN